MSIPDSLIRDTSLHGVVHELPLNQDVADHILSFTNKFLTYKDDPDLFWYTLGKETCNLSTLSYHCFRNVQQAFGKSAKFSKSMDMHNIFIDFMDYSREHIYEIIIEGFRQLVDSNGMSHGKIIVKATIFHFRIFPSKY